MSINYGSTLLVLFLLASGVAHKDLNGTQQVFIITCDHESQISCQNETLETIAAKVREQSDLQIDIKIPYLQLNTIARFDNLRSLVINGEPSLTTINCTNSGIASTGIVLNIMETVILKNLNITFCGLQINRNNKTYSCALTIDHCKIVQLNRVVIARSRGTGLTILNHQDSEVNIASAIFNENTLPDEYALQSILGGGGMYIIISEYETVPSQRSFMSYNFDNCTFEKNSAHTGYHRLHRIDLYTNQGTQEEGYGQGGGVSLVIDNGISNVNISFMNCNFTANSAFLGGGLFVSISGLSDFVTSNVSVEIKDSIFENNGCYSAKKQGFGGGADFNFDTQSGIINSHYLVRNVSFVNNCAMLGGGVYYFSDPGRIDSSNSILFEDCILRGNKAHLGSAVAMTPNDFLNLLKGYTVNPVFQNCQFIGNDVFTNHTRSHDIHTSFAGLGTIYADHYDIYFYGYNRFENNWGSAVYMLNGIVNFQNSRASFVNNTGFQGAAIALIGSSIVLVGPHNYDFINNTAIYEGGAIYVFMTGSVDYVTPRSCFIQSVASFSNTNITFNGNKAKNITAGHAIYATSLHQCHDIKDSTEKWPTFINISQLFPIRGITFDETAESQIATDGATLQSTKSAPLMIIPGEMYKHGVTVKDDLGKLVTDASFRVSIEEIGGIIQLDADSSEFIGNEIQLRGTQGSTATLFLQTISSRKTYISLKVELIECPPGFKLNNGYKCECVAETYVGLSRCDHKLFSSYLLPGYWIGLEGSELVTSSCPFCKYGDQILDTSEIALPRTYTQLNTVVCGDTRKGIACGVCQENYTVHFNSPGYLCKPAEPVGCNFGWIFYILSELVPITVIFISVLTLNISLNSGAINGFILFAQLLSSLDINASGIVTFPDSVQKNLNNWIQGYQVIYGFFTLNIFSAENFSFCLWKNASAMDMLAFKYFTILYILLLIIILIWTVNKCGGRCCGKCCRITTVKVSVVHGISTFLMICYAQCVKISFYMLTRMNFHVKENSDFTPSSRVWLNGDIVYLSKEHLPYALPALFCILTIGVLPPILLLGYPLGNKVLDILNLQDCKIVNYIAQKVPMSSLKPLLDSIQYCYKDNLRFFAGLYFLYRWTIVLVYVSAPSYSIYYIAVAGVLICILILHSIYQPYIKRAHNIIDTLLLANLLLINFLTLVNYHRSRNTKAHYDTTIAVTIVQLILIYTPLVVLGVCLLIFFYRRALIYRCKRQYVDGHKK